MESRKGVQQTPPAWVVPLIKINKRCFAMRASVVCIGMVRGIKPFALVFLLSGSLPQTAIAEDDYLSLISSEAQKVDLESSPSADSTASDTVQPADDKHLAFEQELKDQYKGSYFVYMRLSDASKQSVYQDYTSGSSFDEVRKKILSLYSNHQ
ncbi:MAG: hypothetical protein ABW068_05885 [Candidatus Thiodiazotropha sp.]